MNKRLRKKKLKHSNFIELPLDKLQDIELLESGKLDGEERKKTLKERLGKCFYYEIYRCLFMKQVVKSHFSLYAGGVFPRLDAT